jgi:hypothetical protein
MLLQTSFFSSHSLLGAQPFDLIKERKQSSKNNKRVIEGNKKERRRGSSDQSMNPKYGLLSLLPRFCCFLTNFAASDVSFSSSGAVQIVVHEGQNKVDH